MRERPSAMALVTTGLLFVFGFGILIPEVLYLVKQTHEDVERPWAWFMVWVALGFLAAACVKAALNFRIGRPRHPSRRGVFVKRVGSPGATSRLIEGAVRSAHGNVETRHL
jgi:hypothetical protein